jgi:hypothetical protein
MYQNHQCWGILQSFTSPEIKNPVPFQIIFRLAAAKKGTYLLFIGPNRLRDRDYEVRIHGIRSAISLYLFNHVFIPTKENPPVSLLKTIFTTSLREYSW